MTAGADRGPTVAEIAALTARLRTLSQAGRDADPAEVDRFLADKHELLDRIDADDLHGPTSGFTRSSALAVRELAAEGHPDAEAMVCSYLDDVSERVGVPVHQWGLDESDMDESRTADARCTHDAVQHAHVAITDRRTPEASAPFIVEETTVQDEAGFW
jgi:hypothetical protein